MTKDEIEMNNAIKKSGFKMPPATIKIFNAIKDFPQQTTLDLSLYLDMEYTLVARVCCDMEQRGMIYSIKKKAKSFTGAMRLVKHFSVKIDEFKIHKPKKVVNNERKKMADPAKNFPSIREILNSSFDGLAKPQEHFFAPNIPPNNNQFKQFIEPKVQYSPCLSPKCKLDTIIESLTIGELRELSEKLKQLKV